MESYPFPLMSCGPNYIVIHDYVNVFSDFTILYFIVDYLASL